MKKSLLLLLTTFVVAVKGDADLTFLRSYPTRRSTTSGDLSGRPSSSSALSFVPPSNARPTKASAATEVRRALIPRPSTVVPPLSNRFGHKRSPSRWPSDIRNFSFDNHGTAANGRRSGRAEGRLDARQDVEEDVAKEVVGNDCSDASTGIIEDEEGGGDDSFEGGLIAALDAAAVDADGGGRFYSYDATKGTTGKPTTTTSRTIIDGSTSSAANAATIPDEFRPILALCFLVTVLSALDRVAMSVAILPMASEFHYTETTKGSIGSAISYGYALAILPIGLALSVVSPRALMLGGVGLWSLGTLCTPLMAGLGNDASAVGDAAAAATPTTMVLLPLLLTRAAIGAAEAVVLPTMQRLLANWIPPEKKATVLSIVISGFQLGTVGAYLASPAVIDFMTGLDGGPPGLPGWRGVFYAYGVLGLVWLVPWWLVARDAPLGCPVGDDVDAVEDCDDAQVNNLQEVQAAFRSAPWSDFVNSPAVWGMTIAHAAKVS